MNHALKATYVAGFGSMIVALAALSTPNFSGFQATADSSVIEGQYTSQLERHYDKTFPVKTLGTNVWATIDYLLFNEGRPGVVVGEQGWLYTSEEIAPIEQGEIHLQENLALVQEISHWLQARDIELVVAVIPAKTRLYNEHLGNHQPAQIHQQLYTRFHTALAEQHILAPDFLDVMREQKASTPLFLKTDTHWSPEGADFVAQTLAVRLRQQGWIEPAQTFITESLEQIVHKGDLLSYIPMDPWFSDWMPGSDTLIPRKTFESVAAAPAEDSLFGDESTGITLVGTSYSANSLWNFAGALMQHLGASLVNHAEEGKGPLLPMLTYLSSEAFANEPPQVIIWEFPERYLPVKNDFSGIDAQLLAQLRQPQG
ncbi:MAG: alginate O-acetyltransferase [Hahellaceae bacterium]|nr:alginate O-acetyltransferase [Hahellaceae bacterium]MCP5168315.1 alginate O-acetyltransferase [Hahellaceae bacterium]